MRRPGLTSATPSCATGRSGSSPACGPRGSVTARPGARRRAMLDGARRPDVTYDVVGSGVSSRTWPEGVDEQGGTWRRGSGPFRDKTRRHEERRKKLAAEHERPRRAKQLLSGPVAREMLDRIVGGTYPVGQLIPFEAELCEEFDVSRTVVRDSVRVLVDKGLLSARRGTGTRVEPRDSWRALDPDILSARLRHAGGERIVQELFILRSGIEPVLASIAAGRADTADCSGLDEAFVELERHLEDRHAYAEADAAFHAEVTALSGVEIARELFRIIAEPINLARHRTIEFPDALEVAHAQHDQIYQAIKRGDAEAAASAMREHMAWNQERMNELEEKTGMQAAPHAVGPRRSRRSSSTG